MPYKTFSEAAYHVLKGRNGIPMNIKDIIEEVMADGLWERRTSSRPDTINSSLYGTLVKDIENYGENSRFGRIGNSGNFFARDNYNDDLLLRDLKLDGMLSKDETRESTTSKIVRYSKIVTELKRKYNGCCQIENCGFTFKKSDGENYSEAHHLIPLSQGGSQKISNVVILCANHHRIFHYAHIEIGNLESNKRNVIINQNHYTNIVY